MLLMKLKSMMESTYGDAGYKPIFDDMDKESELTINKYFRWNSTKEDTHDEYNTDGSEVVTDDGKRTTNYTQRQR